MPADVHRYRTIVPRMDSDRYAVWMKTLHNALMSKHSHTPQHR